MRCKIRFYCTFVLVLPVIVAVGFPVSSSAAAETPVKIGVLGDLTGFLAWAGNDAARGFQLCWEMAGMKVGDRPVQLLIEDVACAPDPTKDKARKLIETDRVDLIIGPINGGGDMAIAGYIDEKHVPRLLFTPQSEETIAGRKWTFQNHGPAIACGFAVANYAYDTLGYRTAVTLTSDYVSGHNFIDSYQAAFVSKGGKILQEISYPPNTTNFIPYYITCKQADHFVSWWPGNDGLSAFPQYREVGLTMPIVQPGDGGLTSSAQALEQLKGAAVGTVAGTVYAYTYDTPENKAFVAAYQKKYKTMPGVYAGSGYATGQTVYAALKATGGDTHPDALYAAIRNLNIDTITGQVFFPSETNNVSAFTYFIVKVNDRYEPEVVETLTTRHEYVNGKPVLTIMDRP